MANILFIISGSIAAVRIIELLGELSKTDFKITIHISNSALKWIRQELFKKFLPQIFLIKEIESFEDYNLIIFLPASANMIYKITHNKKLYNLFEKNAEKIIIIPAMNFYMWNHPALQRNVNILKGKNARFLGPIYGKMACGDEGYGRMIEIGKILETIHNNFSELNNKKAFFQEQEIIPCKILERKNPQKINVKNILLILQNSAEILYVYNFISNLFNKNINIICALDKELENIISPLALASISRNPVYTEHYEHDIQGMEHINISRNVDIILIFGGEKNYIKEISMGCAAKFTQSIYLSSKKPIYIIPSKFMESQPEDNDLEILKQDGVKFINIENINNLEIDELLCQI